MTCGSAAQDAAKAGDRPAFRLPGVAFRYVDEFDYLKKLVWSRSYRARY